MSYKKTTNDTDLRLQRLENGMDADEAPPVTTTTVPPSQWLQPSATHGESFNSSCRDFDFDNT